MRLATWIVILSVLNFGIGWVSSSIADNDAVDVDPRSDAEDRASRHGDSRRSGRHGRSRNPYEWEFRSISEKLELDEGEKAAFDEVFSDIETEVQALQKQMFDVIGSSEERIASVLSEEKRVQLRDLRTARSQDFFQSRRDGLGEFLQEASIDSAKVEQALTIYADSDQAKIEMIRDRQLGHDRRRECDERMRELSKLRDEKLLSLLGEEAMAQLEEYRESGREFWRDDRGDREGPRGPRGRRGGDRGGRGGPKAPGGPGEERMRRPGEDTPNKDQG